MLFDASLFKRKAKCFRAKWSDGHFISFDKEKELFMEHNGKSERIWYWQTSDEFAHAVEDLTASDWRYV